MTARKHLKARIRARMARTGEPYVTARRHVVGEAEEPRLDHGYRLRGGVHPDTSAVANVLAHHGVIAGHTGAPLTEAMVLGIGGGLGAGYILWEFAKHNLKHPILGYRNRAAGDGRRLGLSADGGPAVLRPRGRPAAAPRRWRHGGGAGTTAARRQAS
jgi:hypothetical protein